MKPTANSGLAVVTDAAWAASLKIGKAFEKRCVAMVNSQPGVAQVFYNPHSKNPAYDFAYANTTGAYHTVECKCDAMAPQTGNCFIQTKKNGRPHGIATTQAEYWFFNIGDPLTGDILVLRALALYKHLCSLRDAGLIRAVDGAGRSANTGGYLLTVEQLRSCPGAWEWKPKTNGG